MNNGSPNPGPGRLDQAAPRNDFGLNELSGATLLSIACGREVRQHAAPLSIYPAVDVGNVLISLDGLSVEGAGVLAAASHPGKVSGYASMSCNLCHRGMAQKARTDDAEDARAGNRTCLGRYQYPVLRDATRNLLHVIGDHCPVEGILKFNQERWNL